MSDYKHLTQFGEDVSGGWRPIPGCGCGECPPKAKLGRGRALLDLLDNSQMPDDSKFRAGALTLGELRAMRDLIVDEWR